MDRRLLLAPLLTLSYWPTFIGVGAVVNATGPLHISDRSLNSARAAFEDLTTVPVSPKLSPAAESIHLNENLSSQIQEIAVQPLFFARAELGKTQWMDDLSPNLRRRLEIAQQRSRTLDTDWSAETPRQKLVELEPQIFKPQSHELSGRIQLVEGAILGDRHIEVIHEVDGQSQAHAQIDYHSGLFWFQNLEGQGKVVGTIRDSDGVVVARAEIASPQFDRANNLVFRPQPSRNFVAQDIESGNRYHGGGRVRLLSGGESSALHPNSWSFIKAGGDQFALSNVSSLMDEAPLFSKRLVRAWLRTLNRSDEPSVVFGKVMHDHRPLADVEISVDSPAPVTYFSGWIPTEKPATSEDGQFLILDLPDGLHELVARRHGEVVGRGLVHVEHGQISYAEITSQTTKVKSRLQIYDAFTGDEKLAHVDFGAWGISTEPLAMLPSKGSGGFALVQPLETQYLVSQMIYREGHAENRFPLVPRAWYLSLLSAAKVEQKPLAQNVIGFVPHSDFLIDSPDVIYFDSSGQITPQGVKGGGFVLVNVDTSASLLSLQLPSGRVLEQPIPRGRTQISTILF